MRALIEKNLQRLLNGYLALDPESKQHLKRLANRVVTIELLGLNLIFQLCFTETEVQLKSTAFTTPDTTIKGTPLSLLHMTLTNTKERKKFFANDIRIEGNLELGQDIIALFDELEIDWEEHLSHITGDVPAHQLNRMANKVKGFAQRLRQTVMQNVNEYVHEEINLFPPREALNDFFQDVDILRMDTDRLEARIAQLHKKVTDQRGS